MGMRIEVRARSDWGVETPAAKARGEAAGVTGGAILTTGTSQRR